LISKKKHKEIRKNLPGAQTMFNHCLGPVSSLLLLLLVLWKAWEWWEWGLKLEGAEAVVGG
jgi:hypothetical protein